MDFRWVRAKDGAVCGVCKGTARALDVPIGLCRLLWICSFLVLGVGLGLYVLLAITLPREDRIEQALKPWFLGVCVKVAQRGHIEIGMVRFIALSLALVSFGFASIAYLVLYFVFRDSVQRI